MLTLLRKAALACAVLVLALLAGPAKPEQSAASVSQSGSPHLFPLSGPYPIQQQVYLWVQSVDVMQLSNGSVVGSDNVRPYFRVFLDTNFCQYQTLDTLTKLYAYGDAGSDCDYSLVTTRGPFDDAHEGVPLVVAMALPDPVGGQSPIPVPVSRYAGDQVRFRFDGREYQPNPDDPRIVGGTTSDPLGGALAKFGPRSNFGGGGDPMTMAIGEYPFVFGPGYTAPYSTQVGIYVSPAPVVPDRNLQITGVLADRGYCLGGVESTFNVNVANPEQVTSQDYTLFMQRLDPQTNKLIGTPGYSQVQQGVAAIDSAVGIATNITLPPGEHHLAVWAHASGTNPGDMATASEFTIACGPDLGGATSLIPTATPASVDQPVRPTVSAPPPTLVPPTSMPGGTVIPATTILLPTATASPSATVIRETGILLPTATASPSATVIRETGILVPAATATPSRRLP
jgi:hypothetical protein